LCAQPHTDSERVLAHSGLSVAAPGGYGAGNTATYVQPDAGGRIVDHTIVRMCEMLGRLRDTAED